jgi:hypothetical protein
MAESYLFNPTEGINKAASQVQASLGNIFSGIIAQKQNDYNIAEKTFENINALTDKLGEYGQQEITSKTTSLLDDAARSIIKNGKLDYSEVGRIRNGVSTIKNRKSAIEAGTQMYKEMAQTALATKDDLLNLGVTLDGMRRVILNPENLSAEDMGRQMQSVYQKNINTTKVMTDILGRVAPKSEYAQTYIGADKGQYAISGTKVSGWELDPVTKQWKAPANVPIKDANGNVVLNPDGTPRTQSYLESITNAVRQQGAPAIAAIRAQMGENSVFQTDEQIVDSYLKQYVQGNNTAQKDLQVKSADELRYSTSRANVSAIEEKNLPTKQANENRLTEANIGLINERTKGERLANELTAETISNTAPLENMGITVKDNSKNVNFGQAIKVTSLMWNGKMTPFVATDVTYDANTKMHYIKGRPAPKGFEGKYEVDDSKEETVIPVSTNSISYKNLVSAINGPALSRAKGQNAKARWNRFNAVEIGQPSSSEQPVTPNPAPKPAPAVDKQTGYNAETKTLYIRRGFTKESEALMIKKYGAKDLKYVD